MRKAFLFAMVFAMIIALSTALGSVDYYMTLPYNNSGQADTTTIGMVNDWGDNTCFGSNFGGEDVVYALTVLSDSCFEFDFVFHSDSGTYMNAGIALSADSTFDSCIVAATVMADSAGSGHILITRQSLATGTYYLLIDNAINPPCIDMYGLDIRYCTPPPANDSCQNAESITEDTTMAFSTIYATTEELYGRPDIWYNYTAPTWGTVTVSLCGSTFDTYFSVYAGGNCDSLGNLVFYDDDGCNDAYWASTGSFRVTAGQNYIIQVSGHETGNGQITVGFEIGPPPPSNDSCANAETITTDTTVTFSTIYATTEELYGRPDIWYEYTPQLSGTAMVSLCGSTFDTFFKVFEGGTCDSLGGLVLYDDDGCNDTYWASLGVFAADSGQRYLIQVSGHETGDGQITVTIETGAPCDYLIGDISGDGQRLGGDVTYGVRFFKGIGSAPKDSCYMDSTNTFLYVAGDCNGNCEFRGSDITRLVAYFKGNAQLACCYFFPTTIPRMLKGKNKVSG
jgi:hypothetical protein